MKGVSKKKTKGFRTWHGIDLGSLTSQATALPVSHGDIGGWCRVHFCIYIFLRDKSNLIDKTRVFFSGKCVRTAAKTIIVDRKKRKALALLCLA